MGEVVIELLVATVMVMAVGVVVETTVRKKGVTNVSCMVDALILFEIMVYCVLSFILSRLYAQTSKDPLRTMYKGNKLHA